MQVSFSCCDLEIIVTSHSGQVGQACCCAEGAWWVVAPELRGVIFTNAKSSARRPVTCVFICYLSSGGPFRTLQRDVIAGGLRQDDVRTMTAVTGWRWLPPDGLPLNFSCASCNIPP